MPRLALEHAQNPRANERIDRPALCSSWPSQSACNCLQRVCVYCCPVLPPAPAISSRSAAGMTVSWPDVALGPSDAPITDYYVWCSKRDDGSAAGGRMRLLDSTWALLSLACSAAYGPGEPTRCESARPNPTRAASPFHQCFQTAGRGDQQRPVHCACKASTRRRGTALPCKRSTSAGTGRWASGRSHGA